MTSTSAARPVLNGRYELHRRIARGGMADVFLAKDQLLDRPVAVKVLFPQYASEPTFVARFRREAQAAANLNHPSIVSVYDWGEHDGTYFIVMEYVEGRTLADVIASEGPLNSRKASEIATDVAVALGFAHRNGTVHRDVKPGNIMITSSGQVKVADFGIARAFGGADDELTQTGSVMGTATYFSPEQAQGKTVDPRSDLYSLGVVLYEMVVGEPPFVGNTPVAIAYKHVQEPAPRAISRNANVPPALDSIIGRLLQKAPTDRYPAAEEVRADLRRFQEGQPLAAGPATQSRPVTAPTQAFDPAAIDSTVAMPMGSTAAMPVRSPDTGSSRAVIDTSRAVPASAARAQVDPVEEYYEPPSRTGVFVVMLAILLVGLVGLIWYITNTFGGEDTGGEVAEEVIEGRVPFVDNLTETEAKNDLNEAGFEFEVRYEINPDVEPSRVIRQDPAGNTDLAVGETVIIWVSQTPEQVEVPILIGMTIDEASDLVRQLGLQIDIEREASDEFEADQVIRTEPEAGTLVNDDSRVTLVISQGPAQISIPNLAGLTEAEANNLLAAEGFTNFFSERVGSATVPAGQVIETSPPAGQPTEPGQAITVRVSDGPQQVQLTNLTGKDQATAEAWLTDVELVPDIQFVDLPAGDALIGLVVDTQPGAGQLVQQGQTVIVRIGRESQETTTTTTESTTTTTEATTTTTAESTTSSEAGGDG